MKSRRRVIGLVALLVVSLGLQGCGQEVKIPKVPSRTELIPDTPSRVQLTPEQAQTIGLALGPVQVKALDVEVQTTGKVQAINNFMAHSYAPVAGQALEVPVTVGNIIREGQLLARVRSDQLGQLEADLLQQYLQNESDIKQAEVQLALSHATYLRESSLFAEKISPRADMEAANAQYRKDVTMVDTLKAKRQSLITSYQSRLSLYGAAPHIAEQVVQQKKLFPYFSLRATKDGILINRNVNPGELVDTTKELFTIADLSRVWLVGDIYERDLEQVHLNQSVRVTLDSMPHQVFVGRVSFMDAMLDPEARTLEIRSEVGNPSGLLKPNMFARVAINVGSRQTLTVPDAALQRNGDFMYVYVPVGPHWYEERKVETGLSSQGFTEIKAGLRAGESVVTQGSLALKGEVLKQLAKGR